MVRSKSWKRSCGEPQRAADRAAGVVDHEVDRRQLGRPAARRARRSPRGRTGRRGRRGPCRRAARCVARVSSSLSLPRATSTGMPPACATLSAVTWPMPDEAPVITTYLPVSASRIRGVAAGRPGRGSPPSSPTACGRRTPGRARAMPEPASAFSVRRESKTAVKLTCAEHLGRARRAGRWSGRAAACAGAARTSPLRIVEGRSARGTRRERQRAGDAAVDRRREPGRAGGRAERVDHLDDRLRLGVDQVEGLAVAVGQVGEVVHRRGDVVDRDDVGVAEVDARPAAARPAGCRAAASAAGRSSRARRPCPSRRSGSRRPRSAGR